MSAEVDSEADAVDSAGSAPVVAWVARFLFFLSPRAFDLIPSIDVLNAAMVLIPTGQLHVTRDKPDPETEIFRE